MRPDGTGARHQSLIVAACGIGANQARVICDEAPIVDEQTAAVPHVPEIQIVSIRPDRTGASDHRLIVAARGTEPKDTKVVHNKGAVTDDQPVERAIATDRQIQSHKPASIQAGQPHTVGVCARVQPNCGVTRIGKNSAVGEDEQRERCVCAHINATCNNIGYVV